MTEDQDRQSPGGLAGVRFGRLMILLLVFLFSVGLLCLLYLRDPRSAMGWIYPRCLTHELTGLYCPGCGTTRSLYCFVHGQWLAGLSYNLLFPLVGLWCLFWGVVWAWFWVQDRPVPWAPGVGWAWLFLVLTVLYAVLRNLPWWPWVWLAP